MRQDTIGRLIAALLSQRAGKTICPSEVARQMVGPGDDWREAMPAVHAVVDEMVRRDAIGISWRGRAISAREGPYRIGTRT